MAPKRRPPVFHPSIGKGQLRSTRNQNLSLRGRGSPVEQQSSSRNSSRLCGEPAPSIRLPAPTRKITLKVKKPATEPTVIDPEPTTMEFERSDSPLTDLGSSPEPIENIAMETPAEKKDTSSPLTQPPSSPPEEQRRVSGIRLNLKLNHIRDSVNDDIDTSFALSSAASTQEPLKLKLTNTTNNSVSGIRLKLKFPPKIKEPDNENFSKNAKLYKGPVDRVAKMLLHALVAKKLGKDAKKSPAVKSFLAAGKKEEVAMKLWDLAGQCGHTAASLRDLIKRGEALEKIFNAFYAP